MEIKPLPTEVNERFRSNTNINNLSQCILELIFNSLDAKASAIAVRVNITKHEVQIIDNGVGIPLNDLHSVGIRYMTSKFESLHSFENKHKYYGYKGESLASLICISKRFNVTTRHCRDSNTYSKTFENGSFINTVPVSERSSKGTTASVNGFLFNCPVKQKRIKNNLELNNIKIILKSLAIIHPKVSFSLRDNTSGKTLLDCYKTQTVSKSLCALYEDIVPEGLLVVKVSKDNIAVSGLIYTKTYQNCKPQLVYVNKRPVNNGIIEKRVKETLTKALDIATTESNSVFVINISCPYTEVDFSFDSSSVLVEFKSWDVVLKCIDKMTLLFTKKYKKVASQKEVPEELLNNGNAIVNINYKQEVDKETQLKYKSSDVSRKRNEKIRRLASINALNNLRKYRKTLGLKKSSCKLRKKKFNIFEETTDLSKPSLTLREIPSGKSLKREKLRLKPTCSKNYFDDKFNSQNLMFDEKLRLSSRSAIQKFPEENEAEGKEFVMDLFLNSLTPPRCANNTSQNKEMISVQKENSDGEIILQKVPITEETLVNNTNTPNTSQSNPTNNANPPESFHISFDNELIKRRRIEKLNKIGTSLIEDKLLIVKNVNYESKSVQTSFSKRSSSVGVKNAATTTDSNEKSKFKRIKSVNKSSQTSFLLENEFDKVSVGIQISRDRQGHDDRRLSQKIQTRRGFFQKEQVQQIHGDFDQNSERSSFTAVYHRKMSQDIEKNAVENIQGDDQNGNIIPNEATFVSHYYPKFAIDDFPKMANTTIEINTRNVMEDFNTAPSLLRNRDVAEVDENYNIFKEGLENNEANLVQNDKNDDFTLKLLNINDEDTSNTSRFFNGGKRSVKLPSPKLNLNRTMPKSNFSILIDTSRLLERDPYNRTTLTIKSDNFPLPGYNQTWNEELQGESLLSFNKFMPAHKSTQKDPKYRGKANNNFFESFVFNDRQKNVQEEKKSLFTFNFQGNEFNNDVMPYRDEWSQRLDDGGNIYLVNKRTGMTMYNILSKESNFKMRKRADFVPKGLSPILKKVDSVIVPLSPTSKKQLNNAIIESYESELDLVKWQEYMDKEDPETFFNKLYEEKRKQIEQIIPSIEDVCIRNVKKVYSPNEPFTFTKDVFKKLDVLGQMDNKFIVALSHLTLVILLDQHAVHERIRVETLLRDYAIQNADQIIFKSTECKESFTINYTSTELQLLSSFKSQFEHFGLFFEVCNSSIKVKKIPLCFAKKCTNNTIVEENLYKFVSNLINDELTILQNTRGIVSNIPKIIQYVINNEACRGAIKFGRKLARGECIQYLKELSMCQLPFQCAHGRPTLYPVLEISGSNEHIVSYNLKKILK